MKSFLRIVAKYLQNKHGIAYENIWFVFPNRRSGMFFKKHFAELFKQPIWAPRVYTLPGFMQQLEKVKLPDRINLLFDLYDSYLELMGTDETFDSFYFWGNMILNDFDHVDKQMVDAKDLFTNLSDLKNIEYDFDFLSEDQKSCIEQFWGNLREQSQFKFQKDFVRIWEMLYPLKENFTNRLNNNNCAYEGMLFRKVATKYSGLTEEELPFDQVYFVGLNALSKSESLLFSNLIKRKSACFLWDYDNHYVGKDFHEAGYFMRDNLKKFPMPSDFPPKSISADKYGQQSLFEDPVDNSYNPDALFSNLEAGKKNIKIYPVNSQILQVKVVHSLLEKLNPDDKLLPELNAVVLPDEKLVLPLLHSLPEKYEHVNITMGYPVSISSTYSFIEALIDLQSRKRKSGSGLKFNYRQVLVVLNHPFADLFSNSLSRKIKEEIVANNLFHIHSSFFIYDDKLIQLIFQSVGETAIETIQYLKKCLYEVSVRMDSVETKDQTINSIDKEINHQIFLILSNLENILSERKIEIGQNTFIRFFRMAVQQVTLPFVGEPLQGLQIMGMLETRTLDFKNVIITSMNEGIYPKNQTLISFIPHNLRKGFDLPVSGHQDATAAYLLYRLIQRAENVHLIYNTQSTELGKSEMSRYLYQLIYDQAFKVTSIQSGFDLQLDDVSQIIVSKKSSYIRQQLEQFFNKNNSKDYISPSALNDYLICSLRFYFRYVARIKVPKEISEDIDALIFGNILHRAIEKLYKPYIGSSITSAEFDKILQDSTKRNEVLDEAFRFEFFRQKNPKNKIPISGKNALAFEVLNKYLKQIIQVDKKQAPIEIVDLEQKVTHQVYLPNRKISVNLGGTIDRLDRPGELVRIVDYKTGSDKRKLKDHEILFDRGNRKDVKAIFQLLVYAYIFAGDSDRKQDIDLGLYITKELFSENFTASISQGSQTHFTYNSIRAYFEENMNALIDEIFDPEKPFKQVDDFDVCNICDFKEICRRG